jgi:hypothetical protein
MIGLLCFVLAVLAGGISETSMVSASQPSFVGVADVQSCKFSDPAGCEEFSTILLRPTEVWDDGRSYSGNHRRAMALELE